MPVVLYEKKGRIVYITINRPEKLNAMSMEVVEGLQKAWVDFRDDEDLWVAVLSGSGRAFCAGADFVSNRPPESTPIRPGPPPTNRLAFSPSVLTEPAKYWVWKPIIGAIHGYAYGAGLWLAMGCDLLVAAEDAKFGLPEPKFGRATTIAPLLLDYLPLAAANELLLLGEPISAERAYQLGLINRVVQGDDLNTTATEMAKRLLENGPLALRAMKEVLQRGREIPSTEAKMALVENVFPNVWQSEDMQEGVNAFREKRKPVWKGR